MAAARRGLTVPPHPVVAWFLRPAARPVVLVGGIEHPGAWGKPCTVQLPAGTHEVAAGLRYRGARAVLGTAPIRVALAEGETTDMVAVNGTANYTPFTITVPWHVAAVGLLPVAFGAAAHPSGGSSTRSAWR